MMGHVDTREVHHGELIERIIRQKGYSITDIAERAGVNRRSVYNWFGQARLKPEVIHRLSDATGQDFSVEILTMTEGPGIRRSPNHGDNWKDKYFDLLERYNTLLISIKLDL